MMLLALALAQTLGLMHRIVHGPLPLHVAHAGVYTAQPVAAEPGQGAARWLQALFTGHDRQHDCRLYDQLSHADLASGDVPALEPVELIECPVLEHPGWQPAHQAVGFLARGPPA